MPVAPLDAFGEMSHRENPQNFLHLDPPGHALAVRRFPGKPLKAGEAQRALKEDVAYAPASGITVQELHIWHKNSIS